MSSDHTTGEAIEISAPTREQAERLAAAIDGFHTEVVPGGSYTVRVLPDEETRDRLVSLFNAIGSWLSAGGLTSSRIKFGEGAIDVLPATETRPGEPATFLLERTRQLEHALTSRGPIEQAKGPVAERLAHA